MNYSVRNTLLPAAVIIAAIVPVTVSASDDTSYSLSANASIVSDYRFRGISLSDKDIAVQGGLDLSTDSGFYVGAWGSSIDEFAGAETELDIYAGYGFEANGLAFDVGLLAYTYPGSDGTAYFEAYSSVGGAVGDVAWTLGAAYAFDQDNLGDQDNIYVYLSGETPLSEQLSLTGLVAYEDGAFGDGKWDWNLGVSYAFEQFSVGVQYVDTNVSGLGSGGAVFTLGASF